MKPQRVLQFITDAPDAQGVVSQVKDAIEGGCPWIQIRMKEAPDYDIEKVAEEVGDLCKKNSVTCIMNDRVDIASKYKLDGVHLGQDDMCVQEARQILGEEAIIGVTANTIEEILMLSQQPMSYFGVGPLRYTSTKKNLRPFIGLDGYHDLVQAMTRTGVTKPAVAIGGIVLEDVYDLLDCGLWGVAVSGAIAHASNVKEATRQFMETIKKFEK